MKIESLYLATIILLAAVSLSFYDLSWDGRYYHQEAMIQLSEGYNPYWDHLDETAVSGGIWINHYPKAVEIIGAVLYSVTGQIEIGKIQNLLFVVSNMLVGFALLGGVLRLTPRTSAIFSVLIACNPVVVSQMLTTYVDGQAYSLLVATAYILLLILYNAQWRWYLVLAPLIFYFANIKFTALVLLLLLLSFFFCLHFIFRLRAVLFRSMIWSGLALMAAVLIIGANPYVTNTIRQGHPFHPVLGSNSIDIMTSNSPREFSGMNRFTKGFLSLFGETDNILEDTGRGVKLKMPFTLRLGEILKLETTDLRIAGFGPLFSGFLLLGLSLYLFVTIREARVRKLTSAPYPPYRLPIDLTIAFLILSSVVNPEFWWARYAPQLWVVPILMLLAIPADTRPLRAIVGFSLAIAFVNLALFSFVLGRSNVARTRAVDREIRLLQSANVPFDVWFNHLDADRLKLQRHAIAHTRKADRDQLTGKYQNILFSRALISHDSPELYNSLERP